MNGTCSEPGCDRTLLARGLCRAHYDRERLERAITGPVQGGPVTIGDDVFVACPDQLLPLADWCAELDAQAIVRTIWPHLLEASLAGLEPFTLDEAS